MRTPLTETLPELTVCDGQGESQGQTLSCPLKNHCSFHTNYLLVAKGRAMTGRTGDFHPDKAVWCEFSTPDDILTLEL